MRSLTEHDVLIVGAGQFGARAARLLSQRSKGTVWAVDRDADRLSGLERLGVKTVLCDGIAFLIEHFHRLSPFSLIVPALPLHLAVEWLKGRREGSFAVERDEFPRELEPRLPHVWVGETGDRFVSYADFLCPSDCAEPAACTVTGEKRETPLYERLRRLEASGCGVYVVRSRQLAPGLGGYSAGELTKLSGTLSETGPEKWLLGTACKCHGVLTAVRVRRN